MIKSCLFGIEQLCINVQIDRADFYRMPEFLGLLTVLAIPWLAGDYRSKFFLSMSVKSAKERIAWFVLMVFLAVTSTLLSIASPIGHPTQLYIYQFQIASFLISLYLVAISVWMAYFPNFKISKSNLVSIREELTKGLSSNSSQSIDIAVSFIKKEMDSFILHVISNKECESAKECKQIYSILGTPFFMKHLVCNHLEFLSSLTRCAIRLGKSEEDFARLNLLFGNMNGALVKHAPNAIDAVTSFCEMGCEDASPLHGIYGNIETLNSNIVIHSNRGFDNDQEFDNYCNLAFFSIQSYFQLSTVSTCGQAQKALSIINLHMLLNSKRSPHAQDVFISFCNRLNHLISLCVLSSRKYPRECFSTDRKALLWSIGEVYTTLLKVLMTEKYLTTDEQEWVARQFPRVIENSEIYNSLATVIATSLKDTIDVEMISSNSELLKKLNRFLDLDYLSYSVMHAAAYEVVKRYQADL